MMPAEDATETLETLLLMKPEILRMGGRRLGDDLYQELWIKFMSEDPRPHWSRPQILRIAKNKKTDMWRKEERRLKHRALDEASERESPDTNPHAALERFEERARVRRARNNLRPKLREVVEAQFDQGKTYQEEADVLGVPVETVRTRNKRALEQLKKRLSLPEPTEERPSSSKSFRMRSRAGRGVPS